MNRHARRLALLSIAFLAACGGPAIQGVATVEILGGDRSVPEGGTALLTSIVTAGSGVDTTVTWSSSDEDVASVDSTGIVTALKLGSAVVTATSTADTSKADTIAVQVVVPAGAVRATYLASPGAPPVLGAGLVMADSASIPVIRAAMTEVEPGLYVGPISPLDDDGNVNIFLPAAADVPPALLGPATELVTYLAALPDCTLVASQPGVQVTEAIAHLLPMVPIPTMFLMSLDGIVPASVTNAPLGPGPVTDEEFFGLAFATWVYAAGDVSIETTGTDCAAGGTVEFVVDVELSTGWNQLAWTYDWDPVASDVVGVNLTNSAMTELYLNPAIP